MKSLNDYLTIKQAAPLFPLAVVTVSKFCREGYLTATKVGNTYLIHADDIRRFIAEAKVRKVGQPRKVKKEVATQ